MACEFRDKRSLDLAVMGVLHGVSHSAETKLRI